MSNIRIRTTPGGSDNYLNVNLDQKFDFIEILSLTLRQEEVYQNFCSDYGVVVGRVTVNNGFGVPNAKVSIFIPIDDIDKENSQIFGLYPYEQVSDRNSDGLRYNLLPKTNETKNDCYVPIGSFPNKREVQDNDDLLYVYCKYYKFTTTTNQSGDYMFFGVPLGAYQAHADVDMSDIGILTQEPYDFIREGYNEKLFETTSKYKEGTNLNTLTQLKSRTPVSINVQPFWGDVDNCQIGINRLDIDLATNIKPHAIFMGSIISDSEKKGINKKCRPKKNMGNLDDMVTGSGRVEMIRKASDGSTERFDVLGGDVIDEDGTWAYQVPMNLDYIITDEFGNLVPTDDESKGLPTRAKVRFRVKMNTTGGEGRLRTRASYLIPHAPDTALEADYTFDERTKDTSFTNLYWNKIYTVSNHITRVQKNCADSTACSTNRNFLGIKNVDDSENSPFPFNKLTTAGSALAPLFSILCIVFSIFGTILYAINKVIGLINNIIEILNSIFSINYIGYILIGCNDDKYCIGCNTANPGYPPPTTEQPNIPDPDNEIWLNCITTVLADALGLLKFDFYNDWVNGTLYAYLLKYKTKRKGKGREVFCDYDCEDDINGVDNNQDGVEDNRCRTISIVDTCTVATPQSSSTVGAPFNDVNSLKDDEINEGLIKKDNVEGELYYAAMSKNNIRLYSTKIVSLGAVFDCDWQGAPKFYRYLVDTTYNIPPLTPEYYLPNEQYYANEIQESGWDTPGSSSGSLIAKITCLGVATDSDNCNNIKRLCELGMGTDEDRRDPLTGLGTPVDNRITNADIENPWVRGAFTYLNYPTVLNNIPLVFIDNGGSINYQDQYYKTFRGYDTLTSQNPSLWFFKNSLYFYFGLIPGNSALQKMLLRYFPACIKSEKSDLAIIIDNILDDNIIGLGTGQIEFHIEGGVGPYTYQWLGPNYGGLQYQCPSPDGTLSQTDCGNADGSQFSLDNLLGGEYTLVVSDAGGLNTTTTVTVSGIDGVQCQVNPSPSNASGNGKISITINGGVAPYNIEIQGVTDGSFNQQMSTPQNTYCYGNCTGPNDIPNATNILPPGEYIVTVIDSGIQAIIGGQQTTINTECSDYVLITQPLNITIQPVVYDATCYNGFGNGQVTLVGGIPPYDIEWVLTASNNPNNQGLVSSIVSTNILANELPAGSYTINIIDLAGNTESATVVINEPPETLISAQTYPPGCALSPSGSIQLTINGQTPPYSVEVIGDVNQMLLNQPNGIINVDGLKASQTPYVVTVTDQNNCQVSENYVVPFPLYGELYVRAFSFSYNIGGVDLSRIIIRFKGGHGGPYHFRLPNGNWINLGNPYTQNLPVSSYLTNNSDYSVYESTTQINGSPTYEFQFWASDAPGGVAHYPLQFDYYLTDGNQQNTYAMFRAKMALTNTGTNGGAQDSNYGTNSPYGCYSYKNNNGTAVNGSAPQGVLLTQPN